MIWTTFTVDNTYLSGSFAVVSMVLPGIFR